MSVPRRIAALPLCPRRGIPVPWFVHWPEGGEPDFRVVRLHGLEIAMMKGICWICGQKLGRNVSFVVGPMCAVNRVSSEPPSHRDCGIYAAQTCPFLVRPKMKRNEHGLPEEIRDPAGIMIKRNPGVAVVWTTRRGGLFRDPEGRLLFNIGVPEEVLWFAEGRAATRAEALESIATGLPLLEAQCESDSDRVELATMHEVALDYLPKEERNRENTSLADAQ